MRAEHVSPDRPISVAAERAAMLAVFGALIEAGNAMKLRAFLRHCRISEVAWTSGTPLTHLIAARYREPEGFDLRLVLRDIRTAGCLTRQDKRELAAASVRAWRDVTTIQSGVRLATLTVS